MAQMYCSGVLPVVASDLSIIVPTLNERDNIADIISAVATVLPHISWEIIFVDDNSPDGTATFVREIAKVDPRIRCVQRVGRRGLSSACVEGILSTASPYVAIMDADGQHNESCLSQMYEILNTTKADIVVGSRYVEGGSVHNWDSARIAMSQFATRIANWTVGTRLTDPMSGFFMMRREVLHDALPRLSAIGFKILLDICSSSPRVLQVVDVPYKFGLRTKGESKLDSLVLWEFFLLLIDKSLGHRVPIRFVSFALVGGSGVFVHAAVLALLFKFLNTSFIVGEIGAAMTAITSNFLLNNALTYRDQRLKGVGIFFGWLKFNLVCAMGAVANVGIANWLFVQNSMWLVSALVGIAVGVVWNYAVSSVFTWRGA